MKLLVTGGCGFIGSHFIRVAFQRLNSLELLNIDKLTYAAHPFTVQELAEQYKDHYRHLPLDICDPKLGEVVAAFKPDGIIHFAAESHVDRSILNPNEFVQTNVIGTQNLLFQSRELSSLRFVHVSTDEVYGSLEPTDSAFTEISHLHPNSPYAASKASSDLIALANARTFNRDLLVTRCSNNYGPYQFPEKLLPLVITNCLEDKPIPVYGDGKQVRDWIHVTDHCEAVLDVFLKGKSGEVYNISHSQERNNLQMVHLILDLMGKSRNSIQHVGDRPAHDRRYALSPEKIRKELGWAPKISLEQGIKETVEWYSTKEAWWKKVKGSDYQKFYQMNYQEKFSQGARP